MVPTVVVREVKPGEGGKVRLVKVTSWDVMKEYRDAGRKVHLVQMGDDGRTPIAWWFEPASRANARQTAQRRQVAALQRDLKRAARPTPTAKKRSTK
jgi:hypothetical protein